jgi:hypothetical protein
MSPRETQGRRSRVTKEDRRTEKRERRKKEKGKKGMQQGQRVKGKEKEKIQKNKAAKKQARFGDESTTYRNGVKRAEDWAWRSIFRFRLNLTHNPSCSESCDQWNFPWDGVTVPCP